MQHLAAGCMLIISHAVARRSTSQAGSDIPYDLTPSSRENGPTDLLKLLSISWHEVGAARFPQNIWEFPCTTKKNNSSLDFCTFISVKETIRLAWVHGKRSGTAVRAASPLIRNVIDVSKIKSLQPGILLHRLLQGCVQNAEFRWTLPGCFLGWSCTSCFCHAHMISVWCGVPRTLPLENILFSNNRKVSCERVGLYYLCKNAVLMRLSTQTPSVTLSSIV
jgi:hypothetical protein